MKLEMYNQGAVYSLHSSDMKEVSVDQAFFMLFPRAFTPVCSAEVDELSQKYAELEGWDCYAGSTDSPEVMQEWRADAQIPLVTILQDTEVLGQFINSDTGYAKRIAVWVKDGEVVDTYREGEDEHRSWDEIVSRTKALS